MFDVFPSLFFTGSVTQFGYTSLIHAAEGGFTECVRMLLDAGANKEAVSDVRVASVCFELFADILDFQPRH